MRNSFAGEVAADNRREFERQALVKVRLELESAQARLANAGYEAKATRGGFIAELNTAVDAVAAALRIVDQKLGAA